MVSFLLSHCFMFHSEESCTDENRSEPQPSEEKKELKVQEGMSRTVKNYRAISTPEASFMSHKIYQKRKTKRILWGVPGSKLLCPLGTNFYLFIKCLFDGSLTQNSLVVLSKSPE